MKYEDIPFSIAIRLLAKIKNAFARDDFETLEELSQEYPNLLSSAIEDDFSPVESFDEDVIYH